MAQYQYQESSMINIRGWGARDRTEHVLQQRKPLLHRSGEVALDYQIHHRCHRRARYLKQHQSVYDLAPRTPKDCMLVWCCAERRAWTAAPALPDPPWHSPALAGTHRGGGTASQGTTEQGLGGSWGAYHAKRRQSAQIVWAASQHCIVQRSRVNCVPVYGT